MVLTALIIAAATTLYTFVAFRTADAVSRFSTVQACQSLAKEIGAAAGAAIKVETKSISGITALRCYVPDAGVDRDNDGKFEYYYPSTTTKLLREKHNSGLRIWFYPAGELGVPGTPGTYWFKATRTDDANPTITDIDRSWSFWQAGVPRIKIPGTVTFTPVAASKLVRVRIVTSSTGTRLPSDGGLSNTSRASTIDLNQRFFWRGAM